VEVRNVANSADEGRPVHPGVGDFEIIIAEYQTSVDAPFMYVYGVLNKRTSVIEAYTNSLAKAKYLCSEFDKDMRLGYDREQPRSQNPLAILLGGGDDEPPAPTRFS
jgi:hypothetical protein